MDGDKKKLMDDAAERLGEHFENVVILCSSHEDGVTNSWSRGLGNNFALAKMCEVWADDFANQRLASEINRVGKDDE